MSPDKYVFSEDMSDEEIAAVILGRAAETSRDTEARSQDPEPATTPARDSATEPDEADGPTPTG